jgi:site-specific DNA-methyltransferase (cytosine-N4-specific)
MPATSSDDQPAPADRVPHDAGAPALKDVLSAADVPEVGASLLRGSVSTVVIRAGSPAADRMVRRAFTGANDVVLLGDAAGALRLLPPESVQTVITSPPYWSLRDYAADGQIGVDEPLPVFIKSLVSIFDEVWRALAEDGTVWVNIGDSYTSGNRAWRAPDRKNPARAMTSRPANPEGTKDKDLIGVPWRFALAMQEAGWWVRSDIIWYKPNCQPESVRDRPTRSHEHIFLFTKSERYHYDVDAVRGPNGRRLRDVWDINTVGFVGAHAATFPTELVRRCVLIGARPGDYVLDPFLGSGTTAAVAREHGRRFVGCELNEQYAALICDRLGH